MTPVDHARLQQIAGPLDPIALEGGVQAHFVFCAYWIAFSCCKLYVNPFSIGVSDDANDDQMGIACRRLRRFVRVRDI
jgi:hypothetical protein